MGLSTGRYTVPMVFNFSTTFLEVPSEPKRDFSGDVATSKSLIGSAKTLTAIFKKKKTVPGVRGKLWLSVITQAKLFGL